MSFLIRDRGNLIDMAYGGKFNIIVHGCNCFNTMGSGIALEVRNRIPAAWEADQKTVRGDYHKLGNYTWSLGKGFNTINAYTQYDFNRSGEKKDHFEYTSFEMILQKLAHVYPTCNFGFPYIGMGRAGGNEERIMSLLESFADRVAASFGTVTLVEYGQ